MKNYYKFVSQVLPVTLYKVCILAAFLLLNCTILFAQHPEDWNYQRYDQRGMRTLLNDRFHNGFYWGLEVRLAVIDDGNGAAVLAGGKIAWVLDHSFAIGFEGYGMFSEYTRPAPSGNRIYLSGGYGGILLEPIIAPRLPVHVTLPVLIGAGSVEFDEQPFNTDRYTFLLAEPGLAVEFNLIPYIRLGVSGKYRFTSDLTFDQIENNFLNGFSGGIYIKFGRF